MRKYIGFLRMKIERRARWDKLWLPLDILLRHIENVYWRSKGFLVIECFGDSHVKVMRRLNWINPPHNVRFRTISVMGATAYGVVNYGSTSGAREIYEQRLKSIPKGHKILIMLGEIDASFLIWSLAKKKNKDVNEVLHQTIDNYTSFLSYVKSINKEVFVCSAPLPTVDDGEDDPDYLAVRGEIDVSKKDRTAMTLKFNGLVKACCAAIDATFIDLDMMSIDDASGLLRRELINPSGLDHHYDENEFASMLKKKMLAMGIIKEQH